MVMKRFGRVGDVPIIGAGTYANNETCAVSATGHGEFFIRNVVSYDISALMLYKGMSLEDAANFVVMEKLVEQKGNGGVIAVDKEGNIAMPFNTPGMFRGFVKSSGETGVMIFRDN
jgi:L-asparaginase / beta-aspartyl-peptidase